MARLKGNHSFLIGVDLLKGTEHTPPVYKSSRRIPQFSAGDLASKVISNAMYGLTPFSLPALYDCQPARAGFFGEK
jgi:hypothetical protein